VFVVFEDAPHLLAPAAGYSNTSNRLLASSGWGESMIGPDATGAGLGVTNMLWSIKVIPTVSPTSAVAGLDVRYALETVPAFFGGRTIGGFVKQYQVKLDRLVCFALQGPAGTVIDKNPRQHGEVGGGYSNVGGGPI